MLIKLTIIVKVKFLEKLCTIKHTFYLTYYSPMFCTDIFWPICYIIRIYRELENKC